MLQNTTLSLLNQIIRRTLSSQLKNHCYVNGVWLQAKSGKTFKVCNPSHGQLLSVVPDMDRFDVECAISSAHESFQTWKLLPGKERSTHLRNWYNVALSQSEELAKLITLESGKPIAESRDEVTYGLSYLEWFSEEARRIYGDIIPSPSTNKKILLMREPVGVAALITPWNFPIAMITRKAGAALASGCTVVVKPAEETPLSAIALASLAEEAKIPKGVFNVVTTNSNISDVGKILCQSPLVDVLSFTGSTEIGKLIYSQCSSTIKKLSMELGGNAPFIVFNSANIEDAVEGCMASKFRNAGQACISTNRVYLQSGIYDEFIEKLKKTMSSKLILGDGLGQSTIGPLINTKQMTKIIGLVQDAVQQGAEILLGGKKSSVGDLFYEPTLIVNVNEFMDLHTQEIFGPIVSVVKFESEDEVLSLANSTRSGLAGYFYSNDISQCWRVASKLETGMVGINEGRISLAEGAFGGIKESGIGREGSRYGIDDYTEMKSVIFGNLK